MQRERESVCRPPVRVGLSRMLQCLLCCVLPVLSAEAHLRACVTAKLPTRHQALLSGCPVGKILGRAVETPVGGDWKSEHDYCVECTCTTAGKLLEVAFPRRAYSINIMVDFFCSPYISKSLDITNKYHINTYQSHTCMLNTLLHQNASQKSSASG